MDRTQKSQKKFKDRLFTVSLILVLILLTFIINLIFFHKPTVIYGSNTTCYVNNLNRSYHTKNCGFLDNSPTKMLLWDAIEQGYVDCPECDANFHLFDVCYTTKYGACFHRDTCHYIDNSELTSSIVFEAIKNGFRPCTFCFSSIDVNEHCIVLPSGLYFHKEIYSQSKDIKARDYKQIAHIESASQNANVKVKIKETTVYKAKKKGYNDCSYCNVGIVDRRNSYSNNYIISSLIALGLILFLPYLFSYIISLFKHK